MPQKKVRKLIIIFSILVICGFTSSYLFLRHQYAKKFNTGAELVRKDSAVLTTLLSEKIDFESMENVSAEKAFSGKRSFKIESSIEYGFGINKEMNAIPGYQGLKNIDIEVKCWAKKKVEAVYVLSVEDKDGKNIYWESKPMNGDKTENWRNLHFTFNLKPETINPAYIIKLYPWNKAKEEFYIDDIAVNYQGMGIPVPVGQSSTSNFLYDFESNEGLTGTESIKQTVAHSGKMACDLTGGREYGPLVVKKMTEVSTSLIKKITASVWVYPMTDKPNAVLTASITNSKGESVFWDGKSTENKPFPKNQWTKINASFSVPPEKISLEDKIQVNVWNKGRTDLLIDDMEVVYGEGADRKGDVSTIDANSIYEKKFSPQKNKPPFRTIYFSKQNFNYSSLSGFTPNDEFIVGDFIKDKSNLDEIICIHDGKAELFSFSSTTNEFTKVKGKVLSVDSLLKIKKNSEIHDFTFFKPTDITFSGDYYGDNKSEIVKLNMDWRFDLKLVQEERGGYVILGNIDFKGYSNDYNPKYYEFTKIISGRFISSNQSTLIVISCNCSDADFNGKHCNQMESNTSLPNSIGLYKIENK